MAFAGLVGLGFTIVSSLVPLTLLVTATASLVYLHSRFVDQGADVDLETHRTRALANKFVAVTASVFAALSPGRPNQIYNRSRTESYSIFISTYPRGKLCPYRAFTVSKMSPLSVTL